MKTVIGIDPGPRESAFVVWDGRRISDYGKVGNFWLLKNVIKRVNADWLVVERVASYGMPVGESVFETVFWSGRFCQAWVFEWDRIPRVDVKMHLCHDSRAKDGNIIQALKDRFEPDLKPRQRPKGVLKGISKDCWQALAVAVTYYDKMLDEL